MVGHDGARRLGWLGTGRMGVEMGRRLLSAGCDLAVFNRSMSKAEPLLRLGAKPVATAPELAARDIVFITVGSSDDLISAVLGPGGLMSGPGAAPEVLIDCSTVSAGVVAQSLAEITVLAEKSGISRQAFLECLNKSVMGSLFTGYKTPAYVNLDFEPTFTATLLRKDFDLGLAAAREHEVPMPVAATVHQLIQGLVGRGYGDSDFAALLQQQADSAGLMLVSEHAEVADGLGTSDT